MTAVLFVAILMIVMGYAIVNLNREKSKYSGTMEKLNHNEWVTKVGGIFPSNLEKIFNGAKNPWHMTTATFQFIRYIGCLVCWLIAGVMFTTNTYLGFFMIVVGILCVWYPIYYYKAIAKEREAEWNKMYEYIWVIKHNAMLYDPVKIFINTRIYIQEHSPHNKELIQGFQDFSDHWNYNEIDDYITQYYPFSIPREIYQIVFNMSKTGEFPDTELSSLRDFIVNIQDLQVEKLLSGVSGKATIYSLPFLMISVIVALMIPMILQIVNFL